MQLLKIDRNTTLSQLTEFLGSDSVEHTLHINQLTRTRNIGEQYYQLCQNTINSTNSVTWQRKQSILNAVTADSDIYETIALTTEDGWKVASELGSLPNYLKLPEGREYPKVERILGNDTPISKIIYDGVQRMLQVPPHVIDESIFNEYSNTRSTQIIATKTTVTNPFQSFKIPWGEVTLYSELADEYVDFPVYPEEYSDTRTANYTQMPDLLYQYEPWQIYTSSGPRPNTFTFDFHRDMWSGDHRDGKANELIRFCQAHCYPKYTGSAVNVGLVSLLVAGSVLIRGVITNVDTTWDGPLGLDGWYLHCKLVLNITEVSNDALNFDVVKNKSVIG